MKRSSILVALVAIACLLGLVVAQQQQQPQQPLVPGGQLQQPQQPLVPGGQQQQPQNPQQPQQPQPQQPQQPPQQQKPEEKPVDQKGSAPGGGGQQQQQKNLPAIPNIKQLSDKIFTSGMPTSGTQLKEIKDNGFMYLVNVGDEDDLSEGGEIEDEAAKIGLSYLELDVDDEDDWKPHKVLALKHMLQPVKGQKALYIAENPSNVGCFLAKYAYLVDGQELEQAIQTGKSAGLNPQDEQKLRKFLEGRPKGGQQAGQTGQAGQAGQVGQQQPQQPANPEQQAKQQPAAPEQQQPKQ